MTSDTLLRRIDGALVDLRARQATFSRHAGLFGDPAWELMLQLLSLQLRGERTDLSAPGPALAHIPRSTFDRWVRLLEERGLLRRSRTERSASVWAELTEEATMLFERWAASGQPITPG